MGNGGEGESELRGRVEEDEEVIRREREATGKGEARR